MVLCRSSEGEDMLIEIRQRYPDGWWKCKGPLEDVRDVRDMAVREEPVEDDESETDERWDKETTQGWSVQHDGNLEGQNCETADF